MVEKIKKHSPSMKRFNDYNVGTNVYHCTGTQPDVIYFDEYQLCKPAVIEALRPHYDNIMIGYGTP